jgi:hypothetical protein
MRPVRRPDNLTTFLCRLSGNSGCLKLLEPLGPVQACIGPALPSAVAVFKYRISGTPLPYVIFPLRSCHESKSSDLKKVYSLKVTVKDQYRATSLIDRSLATPSGHFRHCR